MDDNIWEYPFGDLDDDEDLLFQRKFKAVLAFSSPFLSLDHKPVSVNYNKFRRICC